MSSTGTTIQTPVSARPSHTAAARATVRFVSIMLCLVCAFVCKANLQLSQNFEADLCSMVAFFSQPIQDQGRLPGGLRAIVTARAWPGMPLQLLLSLSAEIHPMQKCNFPPHAGH